MGILLANDRRRVPGEKSTPRNAASGKPGGDLAFDGWLTHHLSQLYGPVVDEPIPAELLRRLEERFK